MKKQIIFNFTFVFFFILSIEAQNTTFNNVAIGTDGPAYGAIIKSNFPGYNGTWVRGFSVSNETGNQSFFTFASLGSAVNGVSSVTSSFIGKDFDNRYMIFLPNGNVGIGTVSPRAKLDVTSDISNGQVGTVFGRLPEGDGSGLGTYLGVKGYATQGADVYNIKSFSIVHDFYGQTNSSINFYRGGSILGGFMTFSTSDNTEKMRIATNGNVGIGTTIPDAKLTVNGNIHAKEVKIDLSIPAPDYVFASDYKLKSLQEVEEYIKQNSHLPEVPSAQEIDTNGLMLAEMNMSLLKKVEELTLYMIEQEKKNAKQSYEIEMSKKENNIHSKEIETLKKENESFKTLFERFSRIESQLKTTK